MSTTKSETHTAPERDTAEAMAHMIVTTAPDIAKQYTAGELKARCRCLLTRLEALKGTYVR
jgi:hypothetical protein